MKTPYLSKATTVAFLFNSNDDISRITVSLLNKMVQCNGQTHIEQAFNFKKNTFPFDTIIKKIFSGEFCSNHRNALDKFKYYLSDIQFTNCYKHCLTNPLLKKKGIPECILFVTQVNTTSLF